LNGMGADKAKERKKGEQSSGGRTTGRKIRGGRRGGVANRPFHKCGAERKIGATRWVAANWYRVRA